MLEVRRSPRTRGPAGAAQRRSSRGGGVLRGGKLRADRLGQCDHSGERAHHHGEVDDPAVGPGTDEVDALDLAVADASAEDQGMNLLPVQLVGVAEVLEDPQQDLEQLGHRLAALERLERDRAVQDDVVGQRRNHAVEVVPLDRVPEVIRRRAHGRAAYAPARPAAWVSLSPKRSWSRRRGRGAHQFQWPSSAISEGTSSARTIVASISTARAVPTPSSLMNTICDVAKAPSATQNRIAAAVTMRPVR